MGELFLVPTPIGNLGDMTYRAVTTLKEVDLILAEDTRTSSKLLNHYQITTPMQAFHMHNEHRKLEEVGSKLTSRMHIALISDAGTPGISDPGFLLVRHALSLDIKVSCLPGPTAMIPALVQSGMACDRFVFEGFLPPKKGRKNKIQKIAEEEKTTIIYESPHKILKTLDEISQYVEPQRRICVAKELSKVHETYYRGNINEVKNQLKASNVKGEFIIVLQAKSTK